MATAKKEAKNGVTLCYLGVRMPRQMVERLDAMVEALTREHMMPVSRAACIRKCIELGLTQWQKESR